jgi:hypothetical protein
VTDDPAERRREQHVAGPVIALVPHTPSHDAGDGISRQGHLQAVEFVQDRRDGDETGGMTAGNVGGWTLISRVLLPCYVCEVFFWRYVTALFTVTYEPFWKGD